VGRKAIVDQNWCNAYGYSETEVAITRSRARAAGENGVTFYAPGWRVMVFKSREAAEAKWERHPGFVRWA